MKRFSQLDSTRRMVHTMALSVDAKDRIKRLLPTPILYIFRNHAVRSQQRIDRKRYLRYSSSIAVHRSRANQAAWITMLYHNIEKGLSLPMPRPRFGADAIARLVSNVSQYIDAYGRDEVTDFARAALRSYVDFNQGSSVEEQDIPHFQEIAALLDSTVPLTGGTKTVRRSDVEQAVAGVSLEFFTSRSSVRQFSDEPVDEADVKFAASAAQKSPAVCNRQFARVYISYDRSVIDQALAIQGGARGFGDTVPALAVITTSVRAYWNAEERMQVWTDGGMFAMSFVLGLHARSLGSVCLNWSKNAEVDAKFRRSFAIGEDEVIVMLVAFGSLRPEYRVAYSPRLPVDHTIHKLEVR